MDAFPKGRSLPAGHSSHAVPGGAAAPRKKFPKHLIEIYDIDALLGQGAFSTVWRCKHRQTGQVRAVKKIDTSELPPREIAHEIAVMRLLRHDNVVRCYDVFLEAQFVNIVVDMFAGGDLIDGLNAHRRAKGRMSDAQLAHLARQMVAAVAHVHSLQIVHRDIKGENFLADRPNIGDPGCRVALADFGTAIRIEPGEKLASRVGTPAFWAPEMWAGGYDFLVDVWAVGVTSFILLTGALPFEGEAQICRPVADGEPPFAVPYFASRLCADFIGRCLEKDPRGRPQAAEAAQHLWMATPPSEGGPLLSSVAPAAPGAPRGLAAAALGWLAAGLGAVLVGCCNGVACCLDLLLPPTDDDAGPAPRRRSAGGGGPAEERRPAERRPTEHPPDREEIEKQVTELSRQISISSVRPPRQRNGEPSADSK